MGLAGGRGSVRAATPPEDAAGEPPAPPVAGKKREEDRANLWQEISARTPDIIEYFEIFEIFDKTGIALWQKGGAKMAGGKFSLDGERAVGENCGDGTGGRMPRVRRPGKTGRVMQKEPQYTLDYSILTFPI